MSLSNESWLNSQIVHDIITREGGFVDHSADRGGPTNYGITQKTLDEWRSREGFGGPGNVRLLTLDDATMLYLKMYVVGPGYDKIVNYSLRSLVVDTAVNNGRGRATLWLQRAARVVEDGKLGPVTLARVNNGSPDIYNRLCAIRMKAYGAIVSQKHSQVVFIAGWLNRLAEFVSKGYWHA